MTVNKEYHIIGLIADDSFFQILIVSAAFRSSRFC